MFDASKYVKYGQGIVDLAAAYFQYGTSAPVTRSSKTAYTVVDSSGRSREVSFVDQSPSALASAAGVDLETYSLARCIASEGYGNRRKDPEGTAQAAPIAAVGIAQAVRNNAKLGGKSITAMLTYSTWGKTNDIPQGRYGEQSGRYAATSADPNRWHLAVAKAVLNDEVPNLVGAAHKFFDPETQDGGTQAGKTISDAATVLTSWHKENAWIGVVPGTDPYYLMFLRKEANPAVRQAALQAALQVVRAGKQGDHGIIDYAKTHPIVALSSIASLTFAGVVGYLYAWPYFKAGRANV